MKSNEARLHWSFEYDLDGQPPHFQTALQDVLASWAGRRLGTCALPGTAAALRHAVDRELSLR